MYILMALKNGRYEQIGEYETDFEAFRAGMDGKGYCQFQIVEKENEEQEKGWKV